VTTSSTTTPTGGHRKKSGRPNLRSLAATKIIEVALKEDVTVADLSAFAVADPAFALRLLSFVNNPVLGMGRRIDDVRQACSLLGIRGLRNIALSLVVTNLAPSGTDGELLLANCMRRAVAARQFALELKEPEPDCHFTNGLFLDAGLLAVSKEELEIVVAIARSPAAHRVVRERAAGLVPHPIRGSEIARNHFLGDDIASAIVHHHDDELPSDRPGQIAWLAERAAGLFEGAIPSGSERTLKSAALAVGLSASALESILGRIPVGVQEFAIVLDRSVGSQIDLAALRERVQESLVALSEQYESLVLALESVVGQKEAVERCLREANTRLETLASTDELTKVANRRAIEAALRRDLARADRESTNLSVILLDIDHFKSINDTWGHTTGDAVLSMMGPLLATALRGGDLVGRWGGEEFLCVLPSTDLTGATVVAERLRTLLPGNAVSGPRGLVQVTASFGVASVRGPGCRSAAEDLIRRVDTALYAAKEGGRDRVVTSH
jgi:diguanylate cyclase (GGDEF)-like protein